MQCLFKPNKGWLNVAWIWLKRHILRGISAFGDDWTPRSNPCSPYWRETFHWKRGVVCGKRWWTPMEMGRFGWFHWTRYIFGHQYYASNISTWSWIWNLTHIDTGDFLNFTWYALGGYTVYVCNRIICFLLAVGFPCTWFLLRVRVATKWWVKLMCILTPLIQATDFTHNEAGHLNH